MVGTYIAHTCPLEAPNTLDGTIHSIHSLGVEGREERVLERVVAHHYLLLVPNWLVTELNYSYLICRELIVIDEDILEIVVAS